MVDMRRITLYSTLLLAMMSTASAQLFGTFIEGTSTVFTFLSTNIQVTTFLFFVGVFYAIIWIGATTTFGERTQNNPSLIAVLSLVASIFISIVATLAVDRFFKGSIVDLLGPVFIIIASLTIVVLIGFAFYKKSGNKAGPGLLYVISLGYVIMFNIIESFYGNFATKLGALGSWLLLFYALFIAVWVILGLKLVFNAVTAYKLKPIDRKDLARGRRALRQRAEAGVGAVRAVIGGATKPIAELMSQEAKLKRYERNLSNAQAALKNIRSAAEKGDQKAATKAYLELVEVVDLLNGYSSSARRFVLKLTKAFGDSNYTHEDEIKNLFVSMGKNLKEIGDYMQYIKRDIGDSKWGNVERNVKFIEGEIRELLVYAQQLEDYENDLNEGLLAATS